MEPLSLETFDPVYAREPYLNTPRSLEACRLHGVEPKELVEIPYRDFQHAFPGEPEVALRRFERIDAARRHILESVMEKWHEICIQEEKTGYFFKSGPKGETIIEVDSNHYSTVLEIQAAHFRKIEKNQWKTLQKMLFQEMKKAVNDQQGKKVLLRQETMHGEKLALKKRMIEEVEAKVRREIEAAKKKEEDLMMEIKEAQKYFTEEALLKKLQEEEDLRQEKANQNRREYERLRREKFLKQHKEESRLQTRLDQDERYRQLELREAETKDRLDAERREKEKAIRDKREATEAQVRNAQSVLKEQAKRRVDTTLAKIEGFEKRLADIGEEKKEAHQKYLEGQGALIQEKSLKIRHEKEALLKAKVEKTIAELEDKEATASRELQRVRGERGRRKMLKDLKTETQALIAARKKKADEFRLKKIEDSIRMKDERYDTIKAGEKTLRMMRENMAEVLAKTRSELKSGFHQLDSRDMLSPDNVFATTADHSSEVMFPRLKHTFELPGEEPGASKKRVVRTAPANGARPRSAKRDGSPPKLNLTLFSEEHLVDTLSDLQHQVVQVLKDQKADIATILTKSSSSKSLDQNKTPSRRGSRPKAPGSRSAKKLPQPKSSRGDPIPPLKDENGEEREEEEEGFSEMVSLPKDSSKRGFHRQATPFPSDIEKSNRKSRQNLTQRESRESLEESYEGDEAEDDLADVTRRTRFDTPASKSDSDKSSRAYRRQVTPFVSEVELSEKFGDFYDDDEDSESPPSAPPSLPQSQSQSKGAPTSSVARAGSNQSSYSPTPSPNVQKQKRDEKTFRRENSGDHPLAGGTGQYKKELGSGLKPLAPIPHSTKTSGEEKLSEVISKQEQRKLDNQRQLDGLRKRQNETLLKVLDEERRAEEIRSGMARSVTDSKERGRLELVFTEERQRASERIIAMTKDHESKMRELVIAMDFSS